MSRLAKLQNDMDERLTKMQRDMERNRKLNKSGLSGLRRMFEHLERDFFFIAFDVFFAPLSLVTKRGVMDVGGVGLYFDIF